jgi:hypothetical protein
MSFRKSLSLLLAVLIFLSVPLGSFAADLSAIQTELNSLLARVVQIDREIDQGDVRARQITAELQANQTNTSPEAIQRSIDLVNETLALYARKTALLAEKGTIRARVDVLNNEVQNLAQQQPQQGNEQNSQLNYQQPQSQPNYQQPAQNNSVSAIINHSYVSSDSWTIANKVSLRMMIQNTSTQAETLYGAMTLQKPDGSIYDPAWISIYLNPYESGEVIWDYYPDQAGSYILVFGVWKDRNTPLTTTGWNNSFEISSGSNYVPVIEEYVDASITRGVADVNGNDVFFEMEMQNTGNVAAVFEAAATVRNGSGGSFDLPKQSFFLQPGESVFASWSQYLYAGTYDYVFGVWCGNAPIETTGWRYAGIRIEEAWSAGQSYVPDNAAEMSDNEDNMCRYVPEEPKVNMCIAPRQIILAEGVKDFAMIGGGDLYREEFPVSPVNYLGSTFVPLRKVVESFGGTVDWVGHPIVHLNGQTTDLEYLIGGDIIYRSSSALINSACLWDIGLECEDVPDPRSKIEDLMADMHDLSTATIGLTGASIAGIFEGLSGAVNSISIKVIGTDTITFKRYGEIVNSAPETVRKLVDMIEAFLVDVSPEGDIKIGDIAINVAFIALPFDEFADSVKIARKGDNFVVNYGDDVAGMIDGATAKRLTNNGVDDVFRISTNQLRDNFHRFFPDIEVLKGQQVHHLFPVKYREYFMRMGINIDDGRHLVPLDQGFHSRISSGWNREWDEFFGKYNKKVGLEQRIEAFKEAEKLANDANIPIYWRRYYDSRFLP